MSGVDRYPHIHRGVLTKDALNTDKNSAIVLRNIGYIPITSDDSAYDYDRRRDEVVNPRQRTHLQPVLWKKPTAELPTLKLLKSV